MSLTLHKPHTIFWICIPLIVLIGMLEGGSAAIDINVHDTYFIIAAFHMAILNSILFGIIGFGYWLMQRFNRVLSKWLNWAHIILTLGGLVILWIISWIRSNSIPDSFDTLNMVAVITVLVIIFGQILYLINIFIGLFKKRNVTE